MRQDLVRQGSGTREQGLAAETVRGTQSFVGVMTEVWRRPSLTGLELLWRWAVGAPIVALAVWQGLLLSRSVSLDAAALEAMTVFRPVTAFDAMGGAVRTILPVAMPVAVWLVPVAAVAWVVMAAAGRTVVLLRFDRALRARPVTALALGSLRAILLTGAWVLWVWLMLAAGRVAITGPAASGGDANVVLYSAMVICGSLLVYVLWAVVGWVFQLAALLAMQQNLGAADSLKVALRCGVVRGKLIEVNLVMCIVKIALLVLAMVFSACPLPFANVESPTFLACWWAGVVVAYLVALDYFHVVHAVAQLSLWRVYEFREVDRPPLA